MFPHDPGKEIEEAFHHPLHEILEAVGNQLHLFGRQATQNNDSECNHPDHDHRVGDRNSKRLGHLLRILRQMVMTGGGKRLAQPQKEKGDQCNQSGKLEGHEAGSRRHLRKELGAA